MSWFERLCRQSGLMIHHMIRPVDKRQVSRRVEEKRLNDRVTLRRTTIEEVEVQRGERERPSGPDA